MTSVLSPLAASFHPHSTDPYGTPNFEIAIFNDGVPTMSVVGLDSEISVLHGISDDALDDNFPPSAQEVAEMEAAESFVNTMVKLAILEEMEEEARSDSCHTKKRWEARRRTGLNGKPLPPREVHIINPVLRNKQKHIEADKIVPFLHRKHDLAVATLASRNHAKAEAKRTTSRANKKLALRHVYRPIQQPNKFV